MVLILGNIAHLGAMKGSRVGEEKYWQIASEPSEDKRKFLAATGSDQVGKEAADVGNKNW